MRNYLNEMRTFLTAILGLCLVCCNNKDEFVGITHPDMAPGMQLPELLTANPGDEVHIKAQLADIHGLKKISMSSATLPLEHSIDLEGKVTWLLDYVWLIPADIEMGSMHIIKIVVEGNTETLTKEVQLLASKATDYECMYLAYEGESEELWQKCLNKQSLPRKMRRDAAYNYSTTLYSPAAGTKVSLLGQKAMEPDIYGTNPNDPAKLSLGQQYISLPGEGYYQLKVNLQTSVYTMERVTPALPVYELYILGDLVSSGWDFEEGKNDMIPVYENNPYIVRRSLKFKDAEGGIKFANKDWSVQINPLDGFTSWEDMGDWAIIDWGNNTTKDIWLPTPGGFYEVTLDYYLGTVTIIEKEEEVAEDFSEMYVAYEGESNETWENALTGFPRIAERIAPYTYAVDIYSPAASTRIKFLSEADVSIDGYGDDAQKGRYITLPEAGYYHIEMNLIANSHHVEKLTPTIQAYEKIYIVGSLTPSNWNFDDATNLMQVLYQDNPYLLRQTVEFTSDAEGDLAFSTADWTMWKPLKECSSWDTIKKWGIAEGSNTQDIWWKAPKATYEITLDYYLGKVTIVKIR